MKKTILSLLTVTVAVLLAAGTGMNQEQAYQIVSFGGKIETGKSPWDAKITFGGVATGIVSITECPLDNPKGELEVNFHNVNNNLLDRCKFHSTSVEWMMCYPMSSIITAYGTVTDSLDQVLYNEATLEIRVADHGEPSEGQDTIRIILWDIKIPITKAIPNCVKKKPDYYYYGTLAIYDTWDQYDLKPNGLRLPLPGLFPQYGDFGDFPDDEPDGSQVRTALDGGNIKIH